MLEVCIVDDEALARARLRRLLRELPDVHICGEAANGTELRTLLVEVAPSLVLLDIEMPGENGLQLAEWLNQQPSPPAIIFLTAFPQFALDAFSVHAAGYLLKPVTTARLTDAIEHARRLVRMAHSGAANGQTLKVTAGRRTLRLSLDEICAFRAEDKGVTALTADEAYFLDDTLKALEARYADAGFVRCHRAWLVATSGIHAIERDSLGHHWLTLRGLDAPVPVSRRQLATLQALLDRH